MPRRKGRKNPQPLRLSQDAESEEVAVDSDKSIPEVFPAPELKLPEDDQQRLEILNQTPITALYRENNTSYDKSAIKIENKKFCCGKCGKQYTCLPSLKYHLTMSCRKVYRFKFTCLVCGRQFQISEEITSHVLNIHTSTTTGIRTRLRQPMINPSLLFSDEDEVVEKKGKKNRKEDVEYSLNEETEDLSEEDGDSDFVDNDFSIKEETKRKSDKKGPVKRSSKSGCSNSSFAKLNQGLVEAMPWVYDRMKELELEALYPKMMPQHKDFKSLLPVEEWWFCGPQLMHSPPFQIVREKNKNKSFTTDCPGLKAFSALPLDSSNDRPDMMFCVAGPVWAMSWCPTSQHHPLSRQYLAISTHTDLHTISSCYNEPGLIQIWDCGVLELHSHRNETPYFALGLSHYDGPVWDLKWCPVGGHISSKEDSTIERIGLLAAACSSGKVLIIPIPDPKKVSNQEKPPSQGQSSKCMYRMKPSMILIPAAPYAAGVGQGKKVEDAYGQCLCIDWNIANGCKWIVAGFSNGLVAMWKLHEPSSILLSQKSDSDPKILIACRTFRAHTKSVRGIAWCPFKEEVFATAGLDRYLRVWDRSDIESPLKESNWKGSVYNQIQWPLIWCGVYAATDEVFTGPNYHGALYHDVLHKLMTPTALIPFKSSCWSISASDWMNCLAACDAMGETVVHVCSNLNRFIQGKKFVPRIQIFSTDVEWISESSQKEQSEETQSDQVPQPPSNPGEYKLIFHDANMTDLTGYEKRKCCKDVRYYESFPPTLCKKPLVQSVNRVAWNPNFGSHTWIVSGTQSGLVRLHCVGAMHFHKMDDFYSEQTTE